MSAAPIRLYLYAYGYRFLFILISVAHCGHSAGDFISRSANQKKNSPSNQKLWRKTASPQHRITWRASIDVDSRTTIMEWNFSSHSPLRQPHTGSKRIASSSRRQPPVRRTFTDWNWTCDSEKIQFMPVLTIARGFPCQRLTYRNPLQQRSKWITVKIWFFFRSVCVAPADSYL